MWIVQLALRRPYTFVVAALALLLLGVVTISRMPTVNLDGRRASLISILKSGGASTLDVVKRVMDVAGLHDYQ
jgi:multidrug efflux pump subunit AcrB